MKTEEECCQYLSNLSTSVLTEDDKSLCEGKLTLNECWEALNSMKNGKSPGSDEFTKEFYVSFFGELGPLLLETFNYSFEKEELSASQKQAVITLIQKKDRDVMLIKNWRPISLINVDSKIASKALAARMKKVIHSLISYDQTAYVKGRNIGESVRLIDDLLKYAENENIDGYCLQQILRRHLIQWIIILYMHPLKSLDLEKTLFNGLKPYLKIFRAVS